MASADAQPTYVCFHCRENINISILKKHLQIRHNLHEHSHYTCFQNGCMRSFSRFWSYKRHLLAEHTHDDNLNSADDNLLVMYTDDETETPENESVSELRNPSPTDLPSLVDEHGVYREAAMFISRLRASPSVTMSTSSAVVSNVSELITEVVDNLKRHTLNSFQEAKTHPDEIDDIACGLTSKFNELANPFQNIATPYKEQKYFETTGNFIRPEEVILGNRVHSVINSTTGNVNQVFKDDMCYYIPIRSVLKRFLELPGVWTAIEAYKPQDDGILRDIHDGTYHSNHQHLSSENTISLVLYNDDMETANALGSHATIYKLGFFYYTIANLPPVYRSLLENHFLLSAYFTEDRKTYGFTPLLKPALDELQALLVEGIDIDVNNETINVKVILTQVVGDNLGMHGLFGFVESFSSNYPCRFCDVPRKEFHNVTVENPTAIRTKTAHDNHVEQSALDPSQVSNTGVVSGCSLNELPYFHVTENFAPDIMHDMLEGTCPLVCRLVLFELINQRKMFSLETLNQRMSTHNYGPVSNKPPAITKSALTSKLKMSAAEMWNFTCHLPAMIGDLVPHDDRHWQLLITLLDIMSIVFSPAITIDSTYYLQRIITDHLDLYHELYPDVLFKPKQHYLTHYPRCMRKVGPLIRLWCMRFEAKHNFFRRVSHINCNFKNIAKTLSYRHQWQLCYRLYCAENLNTNTLDVGNGSVVFVGNVDEFEELHQEFQRLNIGIDEQMFHASSVTRYGTTYRTGLSVVLCVDEDGLPDVGEIKSVFVLNERVLLCVSPWTCICFDSHFNAYKLEKEEPFRSKLIDLDTLDDYHTYHISSSLSALENIQYIELRLNNVEGTTNVSQTETLTVASLATKSDAVEIPEDVEMTPLAMTTFLDETGVAMPIQQFQPQPIQLQPIQPQPTRVVSCVTLIPQQDKQQQRQSVYDITSILEDRKNFPRGVEVLKALQVGPLDMKTRCALVRILVQELNSRHGLYPTSKEKEQIAKDLSVQFPSLRDKSPSGYSMWFTPSNQRCSDASVPRKKGVPATGVIQTRILNVQNDARMLKKRSGAGAEGSTPQAQAKDAAGTGTDEMSPRLKWIHGDAQPILADILTTYPDYKEPEGYKDVDVDFNALHPNKGHLFINAWSAVSSVLNTLLMRDCRDPEVCRILHTSTDKASAVLISLPGLIPQGYIVKKKGGKKAKWRPTVSESRVAFVDLKPIGTSIEEYRSTKTNYCADKATTWQPQVLALGRSVDDIEEVFVLCSDITYRMPTLVSGVDMAFKLFQVFNLEYPAESHNVWFLIQKAIYEISTPSDRPCARVNELAAAFDIVCE